MIRNIIKSWVDYNKASADLRSVIKPPDAGSLERINKAAYALLQREIDDGKSLSQIEKELGLYDEA